MNSVIWFFWNLTRVNGPRSLFALYVHADLILIDERKGASIAVSKGFEVTGVLGVLELAARQSLLDLADTFTRLKATNFRYRQSILDEILSRHRARES